MSKKPNVKLGEHWKGDKFSGFKRVIGGERFYFGAGYGVHSPNDRPSAERAASAIENEWRRVKLSGGWTAERLEAARRLATAYAAGIDPMTLPTLPPSATNAANSPTTTTAAKLAAATVAGVASGVTVDTLTLHAAVKLFLEEKQADVETAKIEADHFEALDNRLAVLLKAKDSDGLIAPDIRCVEYGRDAIRRIINHFLKRPISDKTGKAIKAQQVTHICGTVGQFFRWLYATERWDGFRAWENAFRIDVDSIRTPAERKAARKGKPKYTLDELTTLFANATKRTRLYILLALNCGMGAKEQATLVRDDIHLDEEAPYIDRERNKTGVQGVWTVWPETEGLLRLALQQTAYSDSGVKDAKWVKAMQNNPFRVKAIDEEEGSMARPDSSIRSFHIPIADLAILTVDGYPLVHRSSKTKKSRRTSAIALAWQRLVKSAAIKGIVPNHGFYALRRTGGQLVRDIAGLETAKVFLAHAALSADGRKSLAEKSYTERTQADFDRVALALKEIHAKLAPMFAAAVKLDAAPKEKKRHAYPKNRKSRVLKKKELVEG